MSMADPDTLADVEWNEVWKARMRRHETTKSFDDPSHNWNRRENAERYYRSSQGEYDKRVKLTLDGLGLHRDMRVLDIGSGPGTLALPMAAHVREVTALDSSEGMLSLLREHADRKGIRNIRTIHARWEDIDPERDLQERYDLVISSLALTMFDLRGALLKMNAVSSGTVCIFWFADMPFWERQYAELWESLHGSVYYPGPKADCVFGVLCDTGSYPDVRMLPLDKTYRFSDVNEAVSYFIPKFGIISPEQKEILRAYITKTAKTDGPGIVLTGDSMLAKILWWSKALP